MQKELLQLMRTLFGHAMVRTPLKDSAEIDNATARLMTVYELDGPSYEFGCAEPMPELPGWRERRDRSRYPFDVA
jgi:hypothetical protein